MASLYKKSVTKIDAKTKRSIKSRSRKWWGRYRDDAGIERRVPLAADKTAAQSMLQELVRRAERAAAGLIDPSEEQRKRPLAEHLKEFEAYLRNKGVTSKQIRETVSQIRKLTGSENWKRIDDISSSDMLNYLGELRGAGRSSQTLNHYLKAAKQFTRWLVRDRRASTDVLAHMSRLNVTADRRHDRRALTPEEFERLVAAAQVGKPIETISGPDRAMMYVLAAFTGFRKGEIGSLTLRSLQLEANPPTATVAACYSKRRRQDAQILYPAVVQRMKEWLATKPGLNPDDLLFPISGRVLGGKERKTHVMMQHDLKDARDHWIREAEHFGEAEERRNSDFLAYCDANGLFADFHSNRHLFITSLERAGLSPKMAQTLARHSDVRLTLNTYTHVGLHDQTAAIASLSPPPGQPKGADTKEIAVLRATGTDGPKNSKNVANATHFVVPKIVPRSAENGATRPALNVRQTASICTNGSCESDQIEDGGGATSRVIDVSCRTKEVETASTCISQSVAQQQVSPSGFEPLTFGFGVEAPISVRSRAGTMHLVNDARLSSSSTIYFRIR